MTTDTQPAIRAMVRARTDTQKVRIEQGNRLCAYFRRRLGLAPADEEISNKHAKKILDILRLRYDKITDGVVETNRRQRFEYDDVITNDIERWLVSQYLRSVQSEETINGDLKYITRRHPMWKAFFEGVKGCGEIMAAIILSEFDIHKAKYPTSLFRYVGLDVAEDGRGRSRRKEHMIDVEYEDRNGKIKTRKSLGYNPFLKSKLIAVLGESFIKTQNEKYAQVYYDYKHRIENTPRYATWLIEKRQRSASYNALMLPSYWNFLVQPKPGQWDLVLSRGGLMETSLNSSPKLKDGTVIRKVKDNEGFDEVYIETAEGVFLAHYKFNSHGHPFKSATKHRHAMAVRYMIKIFLIDLYDVWREVEGLEVHPPYHEAKLGLRHGSS